MPDIAVPRSTESVQKLAARPWPKPVQTKAGPCSLRNFRLLRIRCKISRSMLKFHPEINCQLAERLQHARSTL